MALGIVAASTTCQPSRPSEATDNAKFKASLREMGIWSGGPDRNFESVGRRTLAAMIDHGLRPDHKVLDVGAGSLRVGWWLHYIEPSNYHAIEPVQARIDGAAKLIGADMFAENSAPDAKFLTSVRPASSASDDYMGDAWVGKVEQSDAPGMIRHSLAWIEAECRRNGLTMEVEGRLHGQTWLLIGLAPTTSRQ